ncbi:hypothetical protein MBLNU457_1885t1 [Dothideomycetes sp. NU457]
MRDTTPSPRPEAGPSAQSTPERLPIYNEYSRYTGRSQAPIRQQSPARRPVGAPAGVRSMSPAAAAAARSLANAPTAAAPASTRPAPQNEGRHFQSARRRQERGEASLLMRTPSPAAPAPAPVSQKPTVSSTPASTTQQSEQNPFVTQQMPQDFASADRSSRGRKNSLAQSFKGLFGPSSEAASGYSTPTKVGTTNTTDRPGSSSSMLGKVADFFAPDRHDPRPSSSASRRQQVSTDSRPGSARSLKGFKENLSTYLETSKAEKEARKHRDQRAEQIALALKERAERDAKREAEQKAQQEPFATRLTSQLNTYQQEQEAAERRDRARAERVARLDAERAARRQVDIVAARRQLEGAAADQKSPASAGSHMTTMSEFINPRPQQPAKVSRFQEADDIRVTDKPGEYPVSSSQDVKNEKAPAKAPGFFRKFTDAFDTAKRPGTSDSYMSFADASAPAGMMNACESCGLVPFGPACLSHGKCSNCDRHDSAYSKSTYRDTVDMIDSLAFNRTSYMETPDGRARAIRKTTYEDPGNPFIFEKEQSSPADVYSPSVYSPAEKEHSNQPWRSMSLRRKSYSAVKAADLQTLPESEPVTYPPTPPIKYMEPYSANSEAENSDEYVPVRANWRRASTADDVRLSTNRDSAFYGFYDEILGGKGKRDTVAQSMRRRPSYY